MLHQILSLGGGERTGEKREEKRATSLLAVAPPATPFVRERSGSCINCIVY